MGRLLDHSLHKVNGVKKGAWYFFDTGHVLYVRFHVQRDLKDGNWYFPKRAVDEAIDIGGYVGVLVDRGKSKRDFYFTKASDLVYSEFAVKKFADERMLGLPAVRFAVNPQNRQERINRSVKVR